MGLVNPLGSNSLISITTKQSTIIAFQKMFYSKVNAVAVVDEGGHIVANLSASDLRGIHSESLPYLKLPPLEFLQKMHGGGLTIIFD